MPPKEDTTTANRKPTAAPKPTGGTAKPPPKSTAVKGTGTRAPTLTTTLSITPSATATPTPAPSTGLSGGAIGGIAGGVVVLAALVGLVFYKRRKRAIGAKDGSNPDDKNEPMYLNASNYSKKKGRRSTGTGISAPLALTADADVAPSPFPPPHHDDRYAPPSGASPYGPPPGAGPFGRPSTHSDRNRYGEDDRGQRRGPRNDYPGGGSGGGQHQRNNSNGVEQVRHQPPPPSHGEYYDIGLDQEYFGGPRSPTHNTIGAQQGPIASRGGVTQGNVTPAPEYYLGKEDVDPRRDLRGMDSAENYFKDKKSSPPPPVQDSPRSSFSSDGGSAYMTLEQAQKAHNQKMMGHKESISSVEMLIDRTKEQHHRQSPLVQNRSVDPKAGPLQSPVTPSFAPDNASIAISESTMSMMPSLPATSSPRAIGPQRNGQSGHARQGSDPHLQNKSSSGNIQIGGPKGPNSGPLSPLSQDDPYAESAYSEDYYGDGRSMVSGHPSSPYGPGPHNGMHHPQHQHPGGSRPYSPYPPQHGYGPSGGHGGHPQQGNGGYRPTGPPGGGGYPGGPGPYNNGYNGRPQQPMRGPGGYGGPPHGRPGPGPGPGYGGPAPGGYRGGPSPNNNYPPHGYPGRVASPGPGGYRPHPQQQMRDPGYQNAH